MSEIARAALSPMLLYRPVPDRSLGRAAMRISMVVESVLSMGSTHSKLRMDGTNWVDWVGACAFAWPIEIVKAIPIPEAMRESQGTGPARLIGVISSHTR